MALAFSVLYSLKSKTNVRHTIVRGEVVCSPRFLSLPQQRTEGQRPSSEVEKKFYLKLEEVCASSERSFERLKSFI